MGAIAAVLAFTKQLVDGVHSAVVKVDLGGKQTRTPQHYSSPGDDSHPLPTDFAALTDVRGGGGLASVGYHDPKNEPQSALGEKRAYARDPNTGAPVAEVWCKNSGEIVLRVLKDGGAPIRISSLGPIIVEGPDVRIGDEPGRPIARVGDLVQGSVKALSTTPGNPIAPVPPATLTPSGGVTFIGQIISGSNSAKAGS